ASARRPSRHRSRFERARESTQRLRYRRAGPRPEWLACAFSMSSDPAGPWRPLGLARPARAAGMRSAVFVLPVEQALAVREHHRAGVPLEAPVPGARACDRDDIADLQRVTRPAAPSQAVRAAELQGPVLVLAVLALDIDVEEGVWIHPLDLGDYARQLDRSICVELGGKRMMSCGRNG